MSMGGSLGGVSSSFGRHSLRSIIYVRGRLSTSALGQV